MVQMDESIREELEVLETIGRISASGRRPVHAGFGFTAIKRHDQPATDDSDEAPPSEGLAAELEAAHTRLKAAQAARRSEA